MTSSEHRTLAVGPLRVDRRLLGVAACIALVTYGWELFHFTLSIDEEIHTFATDTAAAWIGQGRWAMALLVSILPRISALPFVSTLLFCGGLALAAALIAPLVAEGDGEQAFFAVLFVVSPVWPHLAEFNTISFGIGFGLVALGLALRLAFEEGRATAAAAAGLLACSFGVYQTFTLAFLVLAAIAFATRPAPEGTEPRASRRATALRLAGVLVAAVALYAAAGAVARRFVPASTYIDVFINWREFLVDFRGAVARTVPVIARLLSGRHPIYLRRGAIFLVLGIAGVLGLVVDLLRRRDARRPGPLLVLALFAGAIAAAVVPEIVSAGRAPVRALITLPPLYAAVAARSLRLPPVRWPQWVALGLAATTGVWISVSLFYSDAVARQRDALTASVLAARIDAVARPVFPGRIPLLVVGYLEPAEDLALRRVEVFGTSFFEHDWGNPHRIAMYLRIMGIPDLDPVPVTALLPIAREVEAMPRWPQPGSVAVVDGKLVLKLGPPSYTQQRELDAARAAAPPSAAR